MLRYNFFAHFKLCQLLIDSDVVIRNFDQGFFLLLIIITIVYQPDGP
jgi:hypothetical protein